MLSGAKFIERARGLLIMPKIGINCIKFSEYVKPLAAAMMQAKELEAVS